MITPQDTCRNLEIYPVKLGQDSISVDISNSTTRATSGNLTKGGADTSLENNNVYGLEPKVYVESVSPEEAASATSSTAIAQGATAAVGVLAVGAVAAVAFALFIYINQ